MNARLYRRASIANTVFWIVVAALMFAFSR